MTDTLARDFDFRVIPIELIDPPPIPMREAMDPEKLLELVEDIRRAGVESPLGVYERDGRFVIIYGHRRRVAAERAGERALPCRVYLDGAASEEERKFRENYFREDVNPAEEATYFADLLERKYNGDIEALCRALHRPESFVQGRLDLLRGDEAVLRALRERKITLAVARELNKFRDDKWRAHYLADAIEQGANTTTVRAWRMNYERFAKAQELAESGAVPEIAPSSEAPLGSADICLICRSADDVEEMEYVRVHKSCLKVHERNARAAAASGE